MDSSPPMTRVIQTELENKIQSGELAEGDRLYSLRTIAAEHGVSIAVALSAVRSLERKGLVVTEPGRGTFVKCKTKRQTEKLRLCSWNGIFPANSTNTLLDPKLNPTAPPDCEATQFFTDEYEGYEQYLAHLKKSVQEPEDALDIVAIDEGLLPVLAEMKVLAPIDELIEKSGIDLNAFPSKVLRGFTYKGKLYGLPNSFTPTFMLFNKSIFEAESAPLPSSDWNWDDLYASASNMSKSVGQGNTTRSGLGISFSINAYAPFITQGGAELIDRSGSCAIASDNAVEALSFFSRLYSLPGVCSHRFGSPRNELADLLANGLLATLIGDANDYMAIKASMPEGSWGICGLPKGKAKKATSLSIHGWGLSSASPDPKKAMKAMASLFAPEGLKNFNKLTSGFPAYKAEENGTPSEIIRLLDEAEISLQSSSPNAFKAFHSTITTALNHRLLLSKEKCLEFQHKINQML